MSKQILKAEMREVGTEANKRIVWNNIRLGEITDDKLARILKATFSNSVCLSYYETKRDGKMVLEIYGDDVPDDFKQMLEMVK